MTTNIKNLLSLSAIAAFLFMAIASGDDKKSEETKDSTGTAEVAKEVKSNWTYEESKDKMTNESSFFASSTSTNTIEFQFPYNGGSNFSLTVRNKGKENEIIIQVSKGQFMPSISGDETLRVKFDDEKPEVYTYNGAADGSADYIFLNESEQFLKKLKTAKKVMIEAPFYEAGRQFMEFDVAGLTWSK